MIEFKNNFRIEYAKGDTYALKITFKNVTQDLTTAIFSVKENADDTTALIEKTIGSGISKVDDNYYKQQSIYKLQLQAEDSQNLQPEHLYLYDLKVAVGNVIKTVISGNFVVKYNVTSVERIETTLANIEVDDVIEADIETTPATSGIEYEQDPIAMAKIGDITNLNTTAKNNLVSAINEVNTKATTGLEEITKIENGTVTVPEATHSTSADNATSATNSTKVQNVDLSEDTSAQFGNYIIEKKKSILNSSVSTTENSGSFVNVFEIGNDFLNKTFEIYYNGVGNITRNYKFSFRENSDTTNKITYKSEIALNPSNHYALYLYKLNFRVYNSYFQIAHEVEMYDFTDGSNSFTFPVLTATKIYEII